MRIKALNIWYSIRSSYWFVPTLMAITAVVLAFITIAVDASVGQGWTRSLGKFFGNDPDAARLLLGTIAGAMITVAGVVFSVTILTLTMASAQFGHRLITNFIRDTGTQVVLGTFVATFLYCLLALLAVSSDTNGRFVPSISVTVSIVLALVSVGVLIFFVHHAAESIQAKSIVAKVSHDLDSLIHRVLPKESDDRLSSDAQNSILEAFAAGGSPIASASSGYLQAIDRGNLVKTAAEHDLILISQYRPGKFVVQGNALVLAWPEEKLDEQLAERIRNRFILGDQRTYEQDVEFAIDQLVEIGVRALSPAINDPFTAMMCIDRLGAALCQLTSREFPPVHFVDENGKLHLIEKPLTFGNLMGSAFNQLRQYGRANSAVITRLLEIFTVIVQRATREDDTLSLLRHAGMVRRPSQENLPEELDRQDVEERYQSFLEALKKISEKPVRVEYLRDEG